MAMNEQANHWNGGSSHHRTRWLEKGALLYGGEKPAAFNNPLRSSLYKNYETRMDGQTAVKYSRRVVSLCTGSL